MTLLPTRDQNVQLPQSPARPSPPVPAAAPAAATGMSGRDVLRTLRRRKWLILLMVLAWSALSVVGTLVWIRLAPIYTAKALLEVQARAINPLDSAERTMAGADVERMKMSLIEQLTRYSVLERAVKDKRIQNTQWFLRDPATAVERLMEDIDISSVPETVHIEVAISGAARTQQARVELTEIATTVAEAFVQETGQTRSKERLTSIQQLNKEQEQLAEDLDTARTRMETIRKTNIDVVDMRQRAGTLNATLTALNRERMELDSARVQAETELATLAKLSPQETRSLPAIIIALQQDPQLPALRNTEVSYTNELESVSRKFGPNHRVVRDYAIRLSNVQAMIAEREAKVVRDTLEALAGRYRSQITAAKAQLVEAGTKVAEVKRRIRDLQAVQGELAQLAAKEMRYLENLDRIDKRQRELRLIRQQEQPVKLSSAAEIPFEPTMPRWSIMVPLGVLLGLVTGLGLTFLLEFMDTSVKAPGDVTRRTGISLLGTVPHTRDVEEDIEDIRLPAEASHSSIITESFRQIRTCLMFSGHAEQRRSLMVTSAQPLDGRTTVAVNLAAAIARGGHSVLVVDANFRRPALAKLFCPNASAGLSNALVGQASWEDHVTEVEANLHVLPAGPMPPNPAELLESQSMRDLLADMLDHFDQVIIDTPPCLVVSDPVVLSTQVDGVIFVVRAGVTTHGITQRGAATLQRVGGHLLGVVLNGMRITAGGYLRKNYETFYRYGEDAQPTLPSSST